MNQHHLNGSHPGRRPPSGTIGGVDFYRRVPKDLTESTSLGATMSLVAIAIMIVLFFSETLAFFRTGVSTSVAVDSDIEGSATPLIKILFNVTFHDLDCDYLAVDLLDSLGNNRQNVTKNVERWQIDEGGEKKMFHGRNDHERKALEHEEHEETIEDLHEDGVHAVSLTSENFTEYLGRHSMVFVDFYAPWCVWCQRLHPTWEKFAEQVDGEGLGIGVAMVDCTVEQDICREQQVRAFPLLRWFHKGEVEKPEFRSDRTVQSLMTYAQNKVRLHDAWKGHDDPEQRRLDYNKRIRQQHPGCMVSGHLMVNRVPGHFHIEARSKNHNLNAAMTNLSHTVNHLSFGDGSWLMGAERKKEQERLMKYVPQESINPLDGRLYSTPEYHQAFHHYIKVVSTHMGTGDAYSDEYSSRASATAVAYPFLEQSQVVLYEERDVPEAKFSYDISPMSVVVNPEKRLWYDYVTSLCAIIGGTFTMLGLIDASLYKVFKGKKLD